MSFVLPGFWLLNTDRILPPESSSIHGLLRFPVLSKSLLDELQLWAVQHLLTVTAEGDDTISNEDTALRRQRRTRHQGFFFFHLKNTLDAATLQTAT